MRYTYKIFRNAVTKPQFVALITSNHGEQFNAVKKRACQIYGITWKQCLIKKFDVNSNPTKV